MAVELANLTREELFALAKENDVKLAPNLGTDKAREAVLRHFIQQQVKIESEERAKLEAEAATKLDLDKGLRKKRKPSPEDVAVETSPLWEITFTNIECEGVDLHFTYGTHRYDLYEGLTGQVLPECVIDHLRKTCLTPIYKSVKDPTDPDGVQTISQRVGSRPRFAIEQIRQVERGEELELARKEAV